MEKTDGNSSSHKACVLNLDLIFGFVNSDLLLAGLSKYFSMMYKENDVAFAFCIGLGTVLVRADF